MIFNNIFKNDYNEKHRGDIENTVKTLEKTKELLDERFKNKQISNEAYIKQCQKINKELDKYRKMLEAQGSLADY